MGGTGLEPVTLHGYVGAFQDVWPAIGPRLRRLPRKGSTRFERLPIILGMSLFSILVIVGILAVVVCFAALYSLSLS
jgi:hypothetical protein